MFVSLFLFFYYYHFSRSLSLTPTLSHSLSVKPQYKQITNCLTGKYEWPELNGKNICVAIYKDYEIVWEGVCACVLGRMLVGVMLGIDVSMCDLESVLSTKALYCRHCFKLSTTTAAATTATTATGMAIAKRKDMATTTTQFSIFSGAGLKNCK